MLPLGLLDCVLIHSIIIFLQLEPLMPIPFHCGIHGFYRHVPGPLELIFRIILIKNFIVQVSSK